MEFETVGAMVESMQEYTILTYIPQEVIVDLVENFFLKNFSESDMLKWPVSVLETTAKAMYIETFPDAIMDPELLESFAGDVTFYLSAKLSKQEILRKENNMFVHLHNVDIFSNFDTEDDEPPHCIHMYSILSERIDLVHDSVERWINENVIGNIRDYIFYEVDQW